MKSKLLALLLLSSCLVLPASAQVAQSIDDNNSETVAAVATPVDQPGTNEAGSDMDALVQKVKIITRTKQVTELPENEPVALDLGLVDVPGVSKNLTEGVTANAYARFVSVDDMKIGQLVLSSVEKNSRVEALNSDNFVAQFDIEQPSLDPSLPISVEGNQAELKAALERLASLQEEEEKEEKEEEVADSGVGASSGSVGSNAGSNPDASSYSTPSALDVGKEPVIVTDITTEGCQIRVDLNQLQAIQQTRVATYTDGSPEYSDCADGDVRFDIKPSYTCAYDEDLVTMKATANFIYYYADASGARQEIGECQPDEEKVFDIVEDASLCTINIDYTVPEVITRAKLVYTNHNGRLEVVRDCAPSATVPPVKMTATTEGCDIRDDFLAGYSYERSKYTYELNGVPYATACQDNGIQFKQETVYKNENGDFICTPIVSQRTGTVTMQSRVEIIANGMPQYRTACTPDTATKGIRATIEGCEDPTKWTHNLSSGQSYGSERYYYLFDDEREYVTDCQDSATIYTHQIEITGWQPHDEKLFAYQLTTVYIENTPVGRHNIILSGVIEGTVQTPYTYINTTQDRNGEVTYEECTRLDSRDEVENYERPNGTIHKVVVGEAEPLNLGNKCNVVIAWDDVVNDLFGVFLGYGNNQAFNPPNGRIGPAAKCGYSRAYQRRSYQAGSDGDVQCNSKYVEAANHCSFSTTTGTRKLIREDGVEIGVTQQGDCTLSAANPSVYTSTPDRSCDSAARYLSPGYPAYPTMTYSAKATCTGSWGW